MRWLHGLSCCGSSELSWAVRLLERPTTPAMTCSAAPLMWVLGGRGYSEGDAAQPVLYTRHLSRK